MRKRRYPAAIVLCLFSATVVVMASACLPRRTRLDRDIPVYLQSDMPPGFEAAIRDCLAVWNREFGTGLRAAGYHEGGSARDGRNTISLRVALPPRARDLGRDARPDADRLGYTMNRRRGFVIRETDILLNISWRMAPRAVMEPEDYCLETLVLHELGHMFGLPHVFREESFMYPRLQPGVVRMEVDDKLRAEFSKRRY